MKKNTTWGGNIEIQAMSMQYGVNIVIHQLDTPRWEVNNFPKNSKQIHLSFVFPPASPISPDITVVNIMLALGQLGN